MEDSNCKAMTKKEQIAAIDNAIKKHRTLAMWGNVESKMRIKELRERKREVLNKC